MISTLLAVLGSLLVSYAVISMRYQFIDGKSDTFAMLNIIGSASMMLSTYWHFHSAALLINGYIITICCHTLIRNRKTD